MQITTERINQNYLVWQQKCQKYGCYSQTLVDEIGDKIKNASFAMNADSGNAGPGTLLNTVLWGLCNLGGQLIQTLHAVNDKGLQFHPALAIPLDSLMRVLLVQHIGKALLFESATEQWMINKGKLYQFNDGVQARSLKLGERSLFLCQKYGIQLSEEEFEAVRIIDKDEEAFMPFSSPLSVLTRTVNNLVPIEFYRACAAQ